MWATRSKSGCRRNLVIEVAARISCLADLLLDQDGKQQQRRRRQQDQIGGSTKRYRPKALALLVEQVQPQRTERTRKRGQGERNMRVGRKAKQNECEEERSYDEHSCEFRQALDGPACC